MITTPSVTKDRILINDQIAFVVLFWNTYDKSYINILFIEWIEAEEN